MDIKPVGMVLIVTALVLTTGCLKSGTTRTDSQTSSAAEPAPAPAPAPATAASSTIGEIPSGSPFSKVNIGMPEKQVYDIIGEPSDTKYYVTGKAWIPFYFGNDSSRHEALYKGWGRLVFTGANAFGGGSFKLYQIINDEHEDGYN